ncbi:MAG: hypothetical protein ACRC78_02610 [Planktothrix sp.]
MLDVIKEIGILRSKTIDGRMQWFALKPHAYAWEDDRFTITIARNQEFMFSDREKKAVRELRELKNPGSEYTPIDGYTFEVTRNSSIKKISIVCLYAEQEGVLFESFGALYSTIGETIKPPSLVVQELIQSIGVW